MILVCLLGYFVCLYFWVSSYSKKFLFYADATITGEGAANFDLCSSLMATVHWGFFLACHTSIYTRNPFIMVISEDPWHSHLLPSF